MNILVKIKIVLIVLAFSIVSLAHYRIKDSTINYPLITNLKDKDKPKAENKVEELIPKASSDSLYKVIFGSLPKNTISMAENSKTKQNKKGRFSFEMTDKVKTKSAFY